MKDVKITVLKKDLYDDLVKEHLGGEELKECSRFEVGQSFITKWQKPEGFCEEGWKAIQHYVFSLSAGADGFWDFL